MTTTAVERMNCLRHGEFEVRRIELLGVTISQRRCPRCVEEQDAADRLADEAREADAVRRRWEQKIGQAGIPERFSDRTLSSYQAENDGQRRVLAFAEQYAEEFGSGSAQGRSALFVGLPGTGKTHLAVGIALSLMSRGRSAMFATVMRAIRTVKDTWRRTSGVSEADAIEALAFPDLLILDEVGVQFGSEAEKLLLFDILNERYERRRSTILLSNLTAQEVGGYLGERVMDRLREDGGRVMVFDWASHRGRARGAA